MFALQDDRTNLVPITTPTPSDLGQVRIIWPSTSPIPYQSIANLSLTKQPEKRRLSGACTRCHERKTKCEAPFPCQRCKALGVKCIQRERKRKGRNTLSQKSLFRPTITSSSISASSSIPTAAPNLWIGPEISMNTQCGSGTFPEVQQDWVNPMSVSFWNEVLEQAYLS
jgi:hypothetical protein